MSILKQLNNINIDLDNLSNLNSQDIIKIEKRLKAEVKFNEAITINDVNNIIDTLRNHTEELKIVYHADFIYFRGIVINPDQLITFNAKNLSLQNYPETFHSFIQVNFKKELESYINLCLKEQHYNALHCLLNYYSTFGSELQNIIVEKLRKKIEFGVEYLELYPSGGFKKVNYLSNPHFYRCLTQSVPFYYEKNIVDLINLSANRKNIKDFYLCVLFALGEYKSSRSELSDIIKENKQIAYESGVREKFYIGNKKESQKTGGAVKTKNKTSSGKGRGISIALGIILVIIKIALYSTRSSYYTSSNTDYYIPNNIKSSINESQKSSGSYFPKLIDTINFFQLDNYKTIKERNVKFDIDSTYFEQQIFPLNKKKEGVFINRTNLDMITLINTEKGSMIKFISAQDTIRVNQEILGVTLYTGKSPKYILYETKDGRIIEGFRFNKWGYKYQNLLNKYTVINHKYYPKMNIYITEDNFGIHVHSIHL